MSDIAQNGYLALAAQSAKGVPATVDGSLALKVTSNSLSGQADLMDDDDEIGGSRHADSSSAMLGGFTVGGTIEGQLRAKVIGYLLMAAGFQPAAPVQDAATGAFTHTFTPGAFTYLTMITRWGTLAVRKFSDCLVNEFSISLDAGGKVTWSASILGTAETFGVTGVTPTFETSPVCAWDSSAVSLDGLGTYKFESVGMSINNNLSDDEWVIGSRFLDDVTPGNQAVEMTGTIKAGTNAPASLTDLYRAAVYGSKTATTPGGSQPYHTAAALSLLSPKLIGTSVTKRFGLIATMPDMVLGGFPLEASGSDRLAAEITGRAYKGASPICSIDLQNDRATIYS